MNYKLIGDIGDISVRAIKFARKTIPLNNRANKDRFTAEEEHIKSLWHEICMDEFIHPGFAKLRNADGSIVLGDYACDHDTCPTKRCFKVLTPNP